MGNDTNITASWGAWQRAQGLAETTIWARTRLLDHFLDATGAHPLKITADQIIEYMGEPGRSQASRSTYHSYLRAYHAWLIRSGRRDDDPTTATPKPKQPRGLPRPVSDTELSRILLACTRANTRMMVLLGSLQGLRIHEIAKIRGDDVNLGNMSLIVNGKGGKTAYLPLHETVAMFAASFPTEGYWFPGRDGHLQGNSVGVNIRGAMRRAGVKGTPHSLRHWYGSTLVENGVDLRTVQELLRHESLATTQIYTRVTDRARRAGIDSLHVA